MTSYNGPMNYGGAVVISVFSTVDHHNLDLRSSGLTAHLKESATPT
jgi:hypothetical protein